METEMLNIDLGTITVPLGRAAKYGQMQVDCDRLPAHVLEYVFVYGVRQVLNDAMAEKKDENGNELPVDQIVAKAQKRLDNMYAGELRARRESQEPADSVEAEAWKMAKAEMTDLYKKQPQWAQVPKGTKDRFGAVVQLRRAMRHLPEMDVDEAVADAIEKFLSLPAKAYIRKNAEKIVALRAGKTVDTDIADLI